MQNSFELAFEMETIWLNIYQITDLLGRDKSVFSRIFRNILNEDGLDRNSVVVKNATSATDGKVYQVDYYILNAILSVRYRVNSKQRTDTLSAYLFTDYAVNERRLKTVHNRDLIC
jgi:hypothetical protein